MIDCQGKTKEKICQRRELADQTQNKLTWYEHL
jgi:hypothetical protein